MLKNYKLYNDEHLVVCLKANESGAFEEIYNRYWYKLYGFAFNQLGSKEEAEQIVQEVFEKLWLRRAVSNIEHLGGYLITATKYQTTNFIKSQISFRKYQEYLIFQEISFQGQDIVNYNDLRQAVEKALQALPKCSD
jgi:DNA-directed RNA polymerase specialized sigma24 family protein